MLQIHCSGVPMFRNMTLHVLIKSLAASLEVHSKSFPILLIDNLLLLYL